MYSVEIVENEVFAVGESEHIFVYRTQPDFAIERMIKTDNAKIWWVEHVQIKEGSTAVMYTVGDKGKIQLYSEEIVLTEPQIDLVDEDVKEKLGAEVLNLEPKSLAF